MPPLEIIWYIKINDIWNQKHQLNLSKKWPTCEWPHSNNLVFPILLVGQYWYHGGHLYSISYDK